MIGYIYGLRVDSSSEYRYIGKTITTVKSRYLQHLRTARYGSTLPVYNWIRKVLNTGQSIVVDTLESAPAAALDDLEVSYITKYQELGYDLLNLTAGGSGAYLYKHSEEQKAKWSKERKGSITGDKNPNYGKFGSDHPSYGRTISEATRKKLSEQKRGKGNPNYGKPLSEETRRKMSLVRKGRPMPSSVRSAHTRWHTNKNVINTNCIWCTEKE